MRAGGQYPFGTLVLQCLGGLDNGACGVDHVIKQQGVVVPDLADDMHDLRNVCPFAALVHDGQSCVEPLGEGPGAFNATGVWGYDDQIFEGLLF